MAEVLISNATLLPFRLAAKRFGDDIVSEELCVSFENEGYLSTGFANTYYRAKRTPCPQCGGSGKKSLFTSVEDCSTCAGAGCYYEST